MPEIYNQALMMVAHEIFDPETNRRVLVDHAFIVAGGEITKAARNGLGNALDASKRSQIMFMDRDDILNLYVVASLPLPEGALPPSPPGPVVDPSRSDVLSGLSVFASGAPSLVRRGPRPPQWRGTPSSRRLLASLKAHRRPLTAIVRAKVGSVLVQWGIREDWMKVTRALCTVAAAVLLVGCTAQEFLPTGKPSSSATPTPSSVTQTPATAADQMTGPFPAGSALCNGQPVSNALNIATATLSSDRKTLSVLIALDSAGSIHSGREFTVTMGRVRHQADYTVSIEETAAGGATASVTDEQTAKTTQVATAQASITDQRVTAAIPTTYLPRLGDHFVWKVEALANGVGYAICPIENSSGVRVWIDFPGRG